MGINVIIFASEIRPMENWHGLLEISAASEVVDKVILVGVIDNNFLQDEKVTHKSKANIQEILSSRLVFGLPAKYIYLKFLNILSRKCIFLGTAPGKVTKALGSFQGSKNTIPKKILTYMKSLISHNYTIAQDFDDAMYLASSFGQDVKSYLPIGLPKNVQIISEFLKDSGERKRGILFVPTHRWDGNSSIIAEWLGNEEFIKSLKKFNIYYNNHPNEEDKAVIHKSVIRSENLSGSVWRNVDILVTDYSSIANDYLAAGGKNVIHIIPDLKEFEDHEGRSPLSIDKQFPGVRIFTKQEFIDLIENITDFKRDTIDINEYSNLWIQKILSNNQVQ